MPDEPNLTRRPIAYVPPRHWIRYSYASIAPILVEAKAAVLALVGSPYQRTWVEALQKIQLKREIAGTSKIEGADFTDRELEMAIRPEASPDELLTRSQRQAHAASITYRWIAKLPQDFPVTAELICDIHRMIVTGCDDDHCEPGGLRGRDYNVTFGIPPHRGCEGGDQCKNTFDQLIHAVQHEYQEHDLLVQALALHYHFGSMHPFMDGNGRTARAIEALMLQRAGLADMAFIAMSNYYYDEKNSYLRVLADSRAQDHDLTAFLQFGLTGITLQCRRLYAEIRKHMERALFRNMMYDLFNRLEAPRTRVIKDRQVELLKILLDVDSLDWHDFVGKAKGHYAGIETFGKILMRDVQKLIQIGAIEIETVGERKWNIAIRPKWPQEITETDFYQKIREVPKGKTYPFLR